MRIGPSFVRNSHRFHEMFLEFRLDGGFDLLDLLDHPADFLAGFHVQKGDSRPCSESRPCGWAAVRIAIQP